MEIEREWNGEEEEVGSLEGRQRRKKEEDEIGKEINGQSLEDRDGEEQRSIYLDSEKGTGVTDVVVEMKPVVEVQLYNGKNLTNGDDPKTKELSREENITVEETNCSSNSVVVINRSTLKPSFEGFDDKAARKNVHGVEGNKQITIVNKSKLAAVDYDLESVLEEQDTHDLYCPNCNSCITRRVILRKRKRWIKEIQCDASAKRIHDGHHDVDSTTISTELADQCFDREAPEVFRCLSCFSFFIPTEGGFNIFRIFGKKEEVPDQQSSPQMSERNKTWISSIFKAGSNQKIKSESEDLSFKGWQGTDTVSKAETSYQNPTTTRKNDAVLVSGDSQLTDEAQRDNLSKNGKLKLARTAPLTTIVNENTAEKSVAGDMLPIHSYITSELQEAASEDKKAALTQSPIEDFQIPVETIIEVRELNKEPTQSDSFNSQTTSIPRLKIQRENQAGYSTGDDVILPDGKSNQASYGSVAPVVEVLPHSEIQIHEGQTTEEIQHKSDWDILKAIVYGGLVESITSLGVVSSAAATGTSTLNIFVLGLANLLGGLLLIVHNLFELRDAQDEDTGQTDAQTGRYWVLLGRRVNFRLHAAVAILSYILVGILPPIIYGFSFQKSEVREYKLISVAAASLLCVALLAIGKAHVNPQKAYVKTLVYYLGLGITVAGLSYVAGVMLKRLLDELGLVDHNSSAPAPPSFLQGGSSGVPAWASY